MSVTLELELYLVLIGLTAAGVPQSQAVAGVCQSQDTMMEMLTKMMEHLDRLESNHATPLYVMKSSNIRLLILLYSVSCSAIPLLF